MFPSGVPLAGRKKGCGAYEAAEPSSPKVTCIGQVRVKAKKKVKSKARKVRSQRGGRREAERDCCPGRNQSWVHQVPLSICETLRGIGSEFSCFLPCGGGSRTGEVKGGDERRIGRSASSSSCGAVLARWVVAVQESEEEVKEVGFLLREREEKVGEVEIQEMGNRGGEKGEILVMGVEEEPARVSVCIPPRNALLLMRCRSDPVRMAALANRFWGSPVNKQLSEEEEHDVEDDVVQKQGTAGNVEEEGQDPLAEKEEIHAVVEDSVTAVELVEEENECEKIAEEETAVVMEENLQLLDDEVHSARENLSCGSPSMLQINLSREEPEKDEVRRYGSDHLAEKEEEKTEYKIEGCRVKEERRSGNFCGTSRSKERGKRRCKEKESRRHSFSSEIDSRRHSFSSEREARRASFSIDRGSRWRSFSLGKSDLESRDVKTLPFSAAEVCPEEEEGAKSSRGDEVTEKQEVNPKPEAEDEKKAVAGEWTELPDCLLMMMYEPKLSMEVSKETWVCGNDFLRWRPHNASNRIPSKPDIAVQVSGDNETAPPPELAPENPAPVSVAAVPAVQNKLSARPAAVAPYEPLVLTRCKSEPVRSSARLTPDACFWKDRHRPIGAAGIGF